MALKNLEINIETHGELVFLCGSSTSIFWNYDFFIIMILCFNFDYIVSVNSVLGKCM